MKFFRLFQVLHLAEKQIYKLKFHKKLKIHNIFYILLFKNDITRKKQVDENMTKLNTSNNKNGDYEIDKI